MFESAVVEDKIEEVRAKCDDVMLVSESLIDMNGGKQIPNEVVREQSIRLLSVNDVKDSGEKLLDIQEGYDVTNDVEKVVLYTN